jgi:thiol-disulfide isomerase/thioredoxin
MTGMKHFLFCALIGFSGIGMTVRAADGAAEKGEAAAGPTLDQYQFGTVVANGEISKDSVQGKVVVLEMWGVHCGPCIAAMPHMVALSKRYDGKGLQVVGLHSQEAPDDEIKAMVKKLKIPFPVTTGGGGPTSENTIPRAMVFNTSGVRIFEGRPTDAGFEKAVKKALKDVAAGSASGSSAAACGWGEACEVGGVVADADVGCGGWADFECGVGIGAGGEREVQEGGWDDLHAGAGQVVRGRPEDS